MQSVGAEGGQDAAARPGQRVPEVGAGEAGGNNNYAEKPDFPRHLFPASPDYLLESFRPSSAADFDCRLRLDLETEADCRRWLVDFAATSGTPWVEDGGPVVVRGLAGGDAVGWKRSFRCGGGAGCGAKLDVSVSVLRDRSLTQKIRPCVVNVRFHHNHGLKAPSTLMSKDAEVVAIAQETLDELSFLDSALSLDVGGSNQAVASLGSTVQPKQTIAVQQAYSAIDVKSTAGTRPQAIPISNAPVGVGSSVQSGSTNLQVGQLVLLPSSQVQNQAFLRLHVQQQSQQNQHHGTTQQKHILLQAQQPGLVTPSSVSAKKLDESFGILKFMLRGGGGEAQESVEQFLNTFHRLKSDPKALQGALCSFGAGVEVLQQQQLSTSTADEWIGGGISSDSKNTGDGILSDVLSLNTSQHALTTQAPPSKALRLPNLNQNQRPASMSHSFVANLNPSPQQHPQQQETFQLTRPAPNRGDTRYAHQNSALQQQQQHAVLQQQHTVLQQQRASTQQHRQVAPDRTSTSTMSATMQVSSLTSETNPGVKQELASPTMTSPQDGNQKVFSQMVDSASTSPAETGLQQRPSSTEPTPKKKAKKTNPKKKPSNDVMPGQVDPVTGRRKKRSRCGTCQGCLNRDRTQDCRECRNCLDQKRYGGPGKLKKACVRRSCAIMATAPPSPAESNSSSSSSSLVPAASTTASHPAAPIRSHSAPSAETGQPVARKSLPESIGEATALMDWPNGPQFAPTFQVQQPIRFAYDASSQSSQDAATNSADGSMDQQQHATALLSIAPSSESQLEDDILPSLDSLAAEAAVRHGIS